MVNFRPKPEIVVLGVVHIQLSLDFFKNHWDWVWPRLPLLLTLFWRAYIIMFIATLLRAQSLSLIRWSGMFGQLACSGCSLILSLRWLTLFEFQNSSILVSKGITSFHILKLVLWNFNLITILFACGQDNLKLTIIISISLQIQGCYFLPLVGFQEKALVWNHVIGHLFLKFLEILHCACGVMVFILVRRIVVWVVSREI